MDFVSMIEDAKTAYMAVGPEAVYHFGMSREEREFVMDYNARRQEKMKAAVARLHEERRCSTPIPP